MRRDRGRRRVLRVPCRPDRGDRAERDRRADLSRPDRGLSAASRALARRPPRQARAAVPRAGRVRGLRASAGSRAPRVLFPRAADPGARLRLLRRPGAGLHAASAAPARIPRRARIGDILARHRDVAGRAQARERRRSGYPPRFSARRRQPPESPCPARRTRMYADIPDPVRRMRRRLRDLPSCAICAEIADARAEWLGWLAARPRSGRQDIGCVAAVPRPRLAGACRCRPGTGAGARRGRPARGRAAPRLCRRCRGGLPGIAAPARPARTRASAPPRRGAPLWRRCAAAASARSAPCPRGRRARVVAGRGAGRKRRRAPRFRERIWFVRPPCGAGDGDAGRLRLRRHRRAIRPMPGWRCCAGSWRSSCGAAPGRPGRRGAASKSAAWLRAGARFAGTV